jgi:LPS-assembly lipoprotein
MSWCNRRFLILALPAALAACGFEPVYGPGGTGSALRNRVLVAEPQDLDSYLLVQELESILGRAADPVYRLDWALQIVEEWQAITATGDITRFSLVGLLDYKLVSMEGGAVLASGKIENFTGYSATGTTVETLAAERDAKARLMNILANQLTTRLYATAELPG